MRITLEADYAVRIIDSLASEGGRLDARSISERTGVTLRFTLKILRKLNQAGIVRSYKGVTGGYELNARPECINLRQVIEAVDGPIVISRCLDNAAECSNVGDKKLCYYHKVFADLSRTIRDKLESVTFGGNQE
jgi:Rrf2 family iron-sulfur cluster assembly transcriptional regulator